MSKINEMVMAKGTLDVVLTGADGQVKENVHIPNLVVTVGKEFIAARMADTGIPAQMSHMAVGSGTTAAANGDTALGTELGRVALTTAGGSVANAVVTYEATFGAGTGTGAVTEAGLFNASSAGTMLCRTVFAVVNKGADDTLSITWTVTIS
jgi:hypothetical protein